VTRKGSQSLRLCMDKRAITPVLSNLLLMVVAVAAMSIAAAATYIITSNLRETMGERIVIEDVWFYRAADGSKWINVTVLNVGKIDVSLSRVYIYRNQHLVSVIRLQIPLEVGDYEEMLIPYGEWESGETYRIEVVTQRGLKVEDYYKAP